MQKRELPRCPAADPQRGLTTVEYAVAGGLISVAVVTAFMLLGPTIAQAITRMANAF